MRSTIGSFIFVTVLGSLLVACGKQEEPLAPPASRPVKIYTVDGGAAQAVRQFPARVDASQRAE